MRRTARKIAIPLAAAAMLGSAGFGYMAYIGVPTSYAGGGNQKIEGYQASEIHYLLTEPWAGDSLIRGVQFRLDKPAHPDNIRAVIANDAGTSRMALNDCDVDGTGLFTCTGTPVPLSQAFRLYLNAAQ